MYSGVRAWQCVKSAKKRTLTVSRFVYIYIHTHTGSYVSVYIHTRILFCAPYHRGVGLFGFKVWGRGCCTVQVGGCQN